MAKDSGQAGTLSEFTSRDLARAIELAVPDFLDDAFPEPVSLQQWQVEVLASLVIENLASLREP